MALEKRMVAAAFWLATALTAPLAAPALAAGETAATVVANVNGVEITLGEMIALRETLPARLQALPDAELFSAILQQLVQQELLRQSVTEPGTREKAVIENSNRNYLATVAIGEVISTAITEEALQKEWDARYANAVPSKEYSASHILVATEEEAKAVKARLDAGEEFATVAQEVSIDTGSGARGGALGWFPLGMMVEPFENALVAAEEGKVTDPVQSQFGWHLILVQGTRDKAAPTLDEAREELASAVEVAIVEAKIQELTEAATIEKPGEALDPALLTNTALID